MHEEQEEDMTLSKGSFQNAEDSEQFASPRGSVDHLSRQSGQIQNEIKETMELDIPVLEASQNIDDLDAKLTLLESTGLFQLNNDLKTYREQLFSTLKKLQDQKIFYEATLADRARSVESLEEQLQKKDQEKQNLARQIQILKNTLENTKKELEKKSGEVLRASKPENQENKETTSQNKITILEMQNRLIQTDLDQAQIEIKTLRQKNSELAAENQELRNVIMNNNTISQNNQNLILNLGIPAYKSQLEQILDSFDDLKINSEFFKLDKNSVFEFCNLILGRYKEIKIKNKYYEENYFEEKANQAREDNSKLKEDILTLENERDKLVELNKDLQLKNDELTERNFRAEKINEIIVLKDTEVQLKAETILKKDKIIKELERLIDIYESQIYTKEHIKETDHMEEEFSENESKESLINKYSQIKREWVLLMKDYKDLRQIIKDYQEKDPNNADKYEESFLNALIRENKQLKEANKNLEEEREKYYIHAIEKVQQFKDIAKNLLGWDIRIKNEIIEMRSVLSGKEKDVLVLKETEEKKYVILDIEDFAKELVTNYPHLMDLKEISFPLFFAYVSVLMKPELKDLFFIL